MTRQKSDQRIGRVRTALLLLILLTSIMVAAASAAPVQEGAETQPDSLDPIVLSREVSADGQSVHMVVEFPVVADTFVTSGLPDTNWGSNSNLRLGFNLTNNFQAQRMLMRYDFSSIPSQAVINSATFRIFQHTVSPSNDAPMGFQARFLNSAWNENQVTWNSHSPDWGSVSVAV